MSDSRVYVVETMTIRHFPNVHNKFQIGFDPMTLGAHQLPSDLEVRDCRRYEHSETDGESGTTFIAVEYVVILPDDQTVTEELQGEYCFVRVPADGEIFDGDRKLLVITPETVLELHGEFAIDVLGNSHQKEVGDAEMLLFDTAFDRLLSELGREYEASCDYDKLPDAITDVLRNRDLTGVSCEEVCRLEDEVRQRLERIQTSS